MTEIQQTKVRNRKNDFKKTKFICNVVIRDEKQ